VSRGTFITLEGPDGAGKSTQARLLAAALEAAGHRVVLTREPGGAPGAEAIRQLLVQGEPGRWSAMTELLLFTAARRDHLERTLAPALAAGAVVVCDRFVDSTRAYQSAGRDGGVGRDAVDALHRLCIGRDPDLTLILDLDPAAAGARGAARGGGEDRFERFGLDFQHRLRAAFADIAAAEPTRCAVIDAAGDVADVSARVRAAVAARTGLMA
jgi:dTMP kinase